MIRLLQAKLKRKHEVSINVGDEQGTAVKIGPGQMFPDLVLSSMDKGHRLEGVIEVETSESVNHLEAMAQWAHFGRARAAFSLYVPAACIDIARRLCTENDVAVSELWSYHTLGDQTRFTLVAKFAPKPVPRVTPEAPKPKAKPAAAKPKPPPAKAKTKPGKPKSAKAATRAKNGKPAKNRK